MKEIKGDILKAFKRGEIDMLAHGCNCQGKFGAGIAKQIAEQYPIVKYWYDTALLILGSCQIVNTNNGQFIANCFTQNKVGNAYITKRTYLDYKSLTKCMKYINNFCLDHNLSLGMPKIGCGLAGGSWRRVKGILEDIFTDVDLRIYYL